MGIEKVPPRLTDDTPVHACTHAARPHPSPPPRGVFETFAPLSLPTAPTPSPICTPLSAPPSVPKPSFNRTDRRVRDMQCKSLSLPRGCSVFFSLAATFPGVLRWGASMGLLGCFPSLELRGRCGDRRGCWGCHVMELLGCYGGVQYMPLMVHPWLSWYRNCRIRQCHCSIDHTSISFRQMAMRSILA